MGSPLTTMAQMAVQRFLALFILWPLLVAANVLAVMQLVKKADQINQRIGELENL